MQNEIVQAAAKKFGYVESFGKHDTGDTVLLIRRETPANPSKPYMTIRAVNRSGEVEFNHGYYDFTEAEAQASFRERTVFSQQCYSANV